MNTDILFQNLLENPAFNTPVAEKTINEIKILDFTLHGRDRYHIYDKPCCKGQVWQKIQSKQ